MKKNNKESKINRWVSHNLDPKVENLLYNLAGLEDIHHIAVMPDVHLAEDVCIGTVIATKNNIYPKAVGGDIGCGVSAMMFNNAFEIFQNEKNIPKIFEALVSLVPLLKMKSPYNYPDEIFKQSLSEEGLEKKKNREGLIQFSTLGGGNHFVEFQKDEQENIWITIHTGSRKMGQLITNYHLKHCTWDKNQFQYLLADSDQGKAYLNDHNWALNYARLSRYFIIHRVADFFSKQFHVTVDESSYIDCHHNHIQLEHHFGEEFWVHRKGAIHAKPDQLSIIPGSMGRATFHVEGRGCSEALNSASHGAGRKMSRSEAKETVKIQDLRHVMDGVWYDKTKEHRLKDEAPQAYKNITTVMKAQKELVKIVRKLTPVLNYKG